MCQKLSENKWWVIEDDKLMTAQEWFDVELSSELVEHMNETALKECCTINLILKPNANVNIIQSKLHDLQNGNATLYTRDELLKGVEGDGTLLC